MSDDTQPIPHDADTRPIDATDATQPMPAAATTGAATTSPSARADEPAAAAPGAGAGHIRVVSASDEPPAAPPVAQRVGTVVWGLVVAAIGVGLLSVAWGANLDAELALIVLLGVAGAALLVGSLAGLRRSRTRREGLG